MEFKKGVRVKRIRVNNRCDGGIVSIGDIGMIIGMGDSGMWKAKFNGFIDYHCEEFLEVVEQEYEVVKTFNIVDIYEMRPHDEDGFGQMFGDLLIEENLWKYTDWEDIQDSETLMNSLPWLEQQGFIKEKIKDIILEAGMKVKTSDNIYRLVIDEKSDFFYFLNGDVCFTVYEKIKIGFTLSDLNKEMSPSEYEVVEDD